MAIKYTKEAQDAFVKNLGRMPVVCWSVVCWLTSQQKIPFVIPVANEVYN